MTRVPLDPALELRSARAELLLALRDRAFLLELVELERRYPLASWQPFDVDGFERGGSGS